MVLKEDLAGILWDTLFVPKKQPPVSSQKRSQKKVFLSEFEIKRRIGADRVLTVERGAILSPLAQEWLVLKNIRIVREE